jgi:hypothetical protein
MPAPLNAVIAGSKSFVDAVQPQLQLWLGAAPEVAANPAAALQACAARGGLLVFEHGEPGWGQAVRTIRGHKSSAAVSIIAAVSDAAGQAQPLEREGIDEVVRWEGRADPVLWAVERILARARPAVPPPLPRERAGAPPSGVAPDIYAFGGTDAEPSALPAHDGAAPSLWPGAVPSRALAEELLVKAAVGELAPGDAGAPVVAVFASLSRLERCALLHESTGLDNSGLVDAAAQRLRVANALATIPASGAEVDRAGAERLLADIDLVLGNIKALTASAPPAISAELEAIRGALVCAGVEFAGALSRLGDTAPLIAAVPARAHQGRSPSARVLSNDSTDEAPARSNRGLLVAFAVALALTVTYHFGNAMGPAPRPLPTMAGAPDKVIAVRRAGGWLVTTIPGKQVDRAEMDAFIARERAKGNAVKQIGAGTWMIEPSAGRQGGTP